EGFQTEVTGIAAGVLYHDGWVYATIAPDLWRMRDTDGDGVADERELLVHGFGLHLAYGGHDMHGLSVGPDGRIYWSIGDKGVNVKSREGRHFFYPNEGCVLRVEPDGSNFEVFAHGLRNVQEPAFDAFGDLFGVDNDADFKGEKERLVYIQEGSDSGWRCNFQYMGARTPWMLERLSEPHWSGQAAYLLPPLEASTDGPCGFKYEPGTAMGPLQRGMFLLNEFPSGVLRGFRIERVGASFKRSPVEVLHRGLMGTGLAWAPDGSLRVTDWAKGYSLDGRGAVMRVVSGEDSPEAREAREARETTRRILEAGFEGRAVGELRGLLGAADQRVRMGAQFELVKRKEFSVLAEVANTLGEPLLARLHAVWGCGQFLRKGEGDAGALGGLLRDADPQVRRQVARVLGEARLEPALVEELVKRLSDEVPAVREQAALALGRLRAPGAVDALFAMVDRDWEEPILRQAVAGGLAGCAPSGKLGANAKGASRARRMASVVALRRQGAREVAGFLQDADAGVVTEAARAIHDGEGVPEELGALARLAGREGLEDPAMRRAINACLRVGGVPEAGRVLALSLNEKLPVAAREEALLALLAWKEPPRLDRVDGYARRMTVQPIESVLGPRIEALLSLKEPELRRMAVELLIAYSLQAKPAQVAAIVKDGQAAASLRAEALRLMGKGQRTSAEWKAALDVALSAKSPAVLQQVGLEALLPEEPERAVTVCERVLQEGSLEQKQHAVAQLVRAECAAADGVLGRLGEALESGSAEAGLQLDILEALTARGAVQTALAERAKRYAESAPGQARAELLQGGAAKAGGAIVQDHLGANCLACHAVTETGSTVGPNLRTIGQAKDRAYLLESLIAPSAKLAPGYGLTLVGMKDGSQWSGAPLKETERELTLVLSDGTHKTLLRGDIANQTPPVSIMPPMLGILKPREIRDVVAYLAELKGAKKGAAAAH
ncbi:MAG: hypothetical protein RLZZ244_670, partial [Verrucomicrobiota bacterium]